MSDLAVHMPAVAQAILGEPNQRLSKKGELRYGNNGSLSVDVDKGTWFDHSESAGGGVLDFIKLHKKLEGAEAFAYLREIGCDIDDAPRRNGHDRAAAPAEKKPEGKRVVEATYDYRDERGELVFQVVRCGFQLPDGSFAKNREGKRKKAIFQRRPDGQGGWINNLEGVAVIPYRLGELAEAIADDRTVYIVEGEKKVDALRKLGIAATCAPMGAGKWPEHFRDYFAGARVVVLPDNDEAGFKHADQVGANLDPVAASNMVLELPDLPPKGDVVDWLAEGGTAEDLADLGTKARAWADAQTPHPAATQPAARFKLIHFGDVKISARPRYLVRGLIPFTGVVVVWGPPKCGKSFWTSDLLFHVALGWPYRGRKVEQGAVVYVILEGETGFSDRIEAFRQRYLADRSPPPFYVISQKLNLVADHVQLIADIRAQMPTGVNPAVVAIDTLNRSLQGSESSDQDMGNYVKAADAIRVAFSCVVPIVHHCGIESARPRGHSSLTGAADAQISVRRDPAKNVVVTVEYMKDGAEGEQLISRLEVVTLGREPDGHPITSCVVVPLGTSEAMAQKAAVQGFALKPTEEPVFRALLTALRKASKAPDAEMVALGVPADTFAVHYRDWREAYKTDGVKGGDAGEAPTDDAIRKQFDRYSRFMISTGGVMGWKRPWLWWTGKHVRGFPETRPKNRTAGGQWSDDGLDPTGFALDEHRTDGGRDPDDPDLI